MESATLPQWQPGQRREPTVRVGIVLKADRRKHLRLAAGRCDCRIAGARDAALLPAGQGAEVTAADGRVELRHAGGQVRAEVLRLVPVTREPPTQGGGICVRAVPAGRGFHWYKLTDERFAGELELRAAGDCVLVVNCLPLEDYLAGVITAEMSGQCPGELLKAQCVVARSWLLAFTEPKHADAPFDRCNDDCCQRYRGTGDLTPAALAAVRQTRGQVLLADDGRVLDANYSKCCGGISEEPRFVWGADKPGISAVVDAPPDAPEAGFFPVSEANLSEYLAGPWLERAGAYCSPRLIGPEQAARYLGKVDEPGDYFRWQVSYAPGELEDLLRQRLPRAANLARLLDLRVLARGVSGRASRLEVHWTDVAGRPSQAVIDSEYEIRRVLHRRFLYSSAFELLLERDAGGRITSVRLRGAGWGHGVGLCQMGALGMALLGRDYREICAHYYPQARLERVYD